MSIFRIVRDSQIAMFARDAMSNDGRERQPALLVGQQREDVLERLRVIAEIARPVPAFPIRRIGGETQMTDARER
jgi:hypothetical protein